MQHTKLSALNKIINNFKHAVCKTENMQFRGERPTLHTHLP